MTVWTAPFGGTFYWMGTWSTNQMSTQRYVSMPRFHCALPCLFEGCQNELILQPPGLGDHRSADDSCHRLHRDFGLLYGPRHVYLLREGASFCRQTDHKSMPMLTMLKAGCDPLKAGVVKAKDQLVMQFMMELFGDYWGLPGLFLSCLFSGQHLFPFSGPQAG